MQCPNCAKPMFLLSTAQKWRIERWIVTESFVCSDCQLMSIAEDGKVWTRQYE